MGIALGKTAVHFILRVTYFANKISKQKYVGHDSDPFWQIQGWGPFKYYVSKEVGGVRKWQFLLVYSTIYADIGGWA